MFAVWLLCLIKSFSCCRSDGDKVERFQARRETELRLKAGERKFSCSSNCMWKKLRARSLSAERPEKCQKAGARWAPARISSQSRSSRVSLENRLEGFLFSFCYVWVEEFSLLVLNFARHFRPINESSLSPFLSRAIHLCIRRKSFARLSWRRSEGEASSRARRACIHHCVSHTKVSRKVITRKVKKTEKYFSFLPMR